MWNGSRGLLVVAALAAVACGPTGQRRTGAATSGNGGSSGGGAGGTAGSAPPADAARGTTSPPPADGGGGVAPPFPTPDGGGGPASGGSDAAPAGGGGGTGGGGGGGGGAGGATSDAGASMPAPDAGAREAATDPPAPAPTPDARPADAAPAPGAANLVAHWKLDEGQGTAVADATGGGNTGRLVNGAAWVAGGHPGSRAGSFALRFDGVDDLVDVTVRSVPAIEARKSVVAWVRFDAAPSLGYQTFVVMGSNTPPVAAGFGFLDNRIAAWQWGGTQAVTAPAPAPGWRHVAYTYDGVIHTIYVDGEQVVRTTGPVDPGPVTILRMGARTMPGLDAFRGLLDDVRVYNRPLLGPEVRQLFQLAPSSP